MFLLSLVFTATIYCNSRNGVIKKILKLPSKVKSVLMVIAKGVVKDAPVVKPLDFTITQGEVSDDSDVDNSVTSDDEDEDDESDNENDSSDSDESESSESKESSEDSKSDTKKSKSSKEKAKTKKEKEDLEDSIKKKDKEIKALKKKISELEASRDYYKKNYIKAKTISERIFQRYKDIGESVIKYEKFQQEKQDKKDKKPKKKTHKVLINEGSENGGDPENEGGKSEDGDDDDGEGKSGDDSNGSGSDENENSSDSSSDGDSKKAPVLKYTTITDLDSLLS